MKKWLLAIGILVLLLTTACNKAETNQTQTEGESVETVGDGSKSVSTGSETDESLTPYLAGGRLGHESIAFIGGGASNKLWVIDAKYHKLITMIDAGGPKLERTIKEYYPNLHDTHAMTFTKDFKIMITVDWFNYDEPSYVIAYDPITFKELWRTPVGKGGATEKGWLFYLFQWPLYYERAVSYII